MARKNAETNSVRKTARAARSSLMVPILLLAVEHAPDPIAERRKSQHVDREHDAPYHGQADVVALRAAVCSYSPLQHADEQMIDHSRYQGAGNSADQTPERQIDHAAAPSSWCQPSVLEHACHDHDHG